MIARRALLAGLSAAPLAGWPARAADPGPYPVEALFRPPALIEARMSPGGGKVALLLDAGRDGARDLRIEVVDAADPAAGAMRLNVGAVEPLWLRWAGETRLLLGAGEPSRLTVTDPGSRGASTTLDLDYRRVLSLPLDGGEPVALFAEGRFRRTLDLAELVAVEDAGHALFAALDPGGTSGAGLNSGASMMDNFSTGMNEMTFADVSLFRVELATGAPVRIVEGRPSTMRWEARGGEPLLRRDLDEDGQGETWLVPGPGSDWRRVRSMAAADPDLAFLAPGETAGAVWVLGRARPDEPRSVRTWDPAGDVLGEPVAGHGGIEPAAVYVDARGRFLLAEYRAGGVAWEGPDSGLIARMKGLQAYFGASSRVRLLGRDDASGRLLVLAAGPNLPPTAGLYDPAARRVVELASAAPWLDRARLADGADGVVGTGAGPLVVFVRPRTRDPSANDFDPWAQAFAGRGWRVLETDDAPGAGARVSAAGAPMAIVSWGGASAAAAALARTAGARALVCIESPQPDADLLGPAQVRARRDGAVEARDGALALLLLRPASARPGARNARLVRDLFARDHIGGAAAAARAAQGGPNRAWRGRKAEGERCAAVADFLARAFA